MKTRFSLFGFIAILLLGIGMYFASCNNNDTNGVVTYKGHVVYLKTTTPFPDLEVKVTNGDKIHVLTHTDADGAFLLKVNVSEIDGSYYVLVGDTSCIPKKIELSGFGQAEVNLGTIEVEGPKEPTVSTIQISEITAESAVSGGNVTDDGRATVTARGVCWSKNEYPTTADAHTSNGTGKGEFQSNLTGLEFGTTYYLRAYATNKIGTAYGEQLSFSTSTGDAQVTTDSVFTITAISAKCAGNVVSDGSYSILARGICWSTMQEPTTTDFVANEIAGKGAFACALRNFEISTTYYVRAFATNERGTTYGEQLTFTTLDGMPIVTTNQITNIGSTKATCGGNVTYDGTLSVTARGVCWSTEQQPTIGDAHTTDGKGLGTFTSSIKNLQDKTTYYVRAYATTAAGTAYGEQRTFTTSEGLPVVQLSMIGDPTASTMSCKGKVTSDGGNTVTERGLCYSTSQYPINSDTHIALGTGTGEFSGTLVGLNLNTTYYVRAYAVNSFGVGYSEQKSFTTLNGIAVVSTTAATNILSNSAVCGGSITSDGGSSIIKRGVCWSSTSATPTISDSHTTDGAGLGTFVSQITGLQPEVTYYVRAYATNSIGTSYGEQIYFTTVNGLPEVTTSAVSNIQGATATCGGTVLSDGGYSVIARGVCWSANSSAPTILDSHTTDGVGTGSFVSQLTNLSESTSYYVRAYATNSAGTSYGGQVYFTTSIDQKAAIVSTSPVSNITYSSATLNGYISQSGYPAYTERGFCYNTSGVPTIFDTKIIVNGTGTGAYTANMSFITTGVEDYYVRAYVIQNGQPIYGEQVVFGPELTNPTIFIGNINSVGASSATINATISNAGEPAYTKRGICYGLYTEPRIENGNCLYVEESASQAESFNITLSNLNSNTIYYVAAYVEWLGHRIYSNTRSFQTETEVEVVILDGLQNSQCTVNNSNVFWSGTLIGGTSSSVSYVSLGFVYDTRPNPTVGNGTAIQISYSGTEITNGTRAFYSNISGLQNATTYYVRAYVQMSYGYVYSDQITIQLSTTDPNIQTYAVQNVSSSSSSLWQAQFQGIIYSEGRPSIQDWGFVYGTSPNPSANDGSSIMVSRQQHVAIPNTSYYAFATTVTGLSPNTVYYVRAFARTAIGYTYGGVMSFSTY